MIGVIIVLAIFWVQSTIVLFSNPKNVSIRWLSLWGYITGSGSLGTLIYKYISPKINTYTQNPVLINVIAMLPSVIFFLSYYFSPYLSLMFSISYSGLMEGKTRAFKTKISILLLLPLILFFVLSPSYFPYDSRHQLILLLLAIPYGAASIYLLISSYFKENNPPVKLQRLITCLIIVSFLVFGFTTSYIGPALFSASLSNIEVWAAVPLFIVFVIFSIRYGALGFRLKFEKYDILNTFMTINSGTSLINHAIKNEIIKINMCAENIKIYSNADKKDIDTSTIGRNVHIILESSKHTLDIVNRIQEHMQKIELKESPNNLGQVIDQSLYIFEPYFESHQINVIKDYGYDINIIFDSVHILEVFNNIFKNAVEAMKPGGTIQIECIQSKRNLAVQIKDDGEGIEKEDLTKVFKPFFSTKRPGKNFGLGLSYCYNVIQMHGGSIDIYSKKNTGTTVYLNFPSKKLVKYAPTFQSRLVPLGK